MRTVRRIAGYLGGAILIGSSAAHSLLGGPAVAAQLAQAHVPADLVGGLRIAWHFGGVAMLVFGLIALHLVDAARRGRAPSLLPLKLIALAYVGVGGWALAATHKPFFFIFVVPGLLLGLAAWGKAE